MSQPRKHHYVPASMLAGFTLAGGQRDPLYAVDLQRRMIRKGKPRTEGYRNDFYAIDAAGTDPMLIEKLVGQQAEGHFAEVLRQINRAGALPVSEEGYGTLMSLLGMLSARVTSSRERREEAWHERLTVLEEPLRKDYSSFRQRMREIGEASTEEAFHQYQSDCDELDRSGGRWAVDSTTMVMEELREAARMVDVFGAHTWALQVSNNEAFVCSDTPIVKFQSPHEGAAKEVIHVALSHRHALLGFLPGAGPMPGAHEASSDLVAELNGQAIRCSHEVFWAPHENFICVGPKGKLIRGAKKLLEAVTEELDARAAESGTSGGGDTK